ncbi:phosphocarrier protein [Ectothiorhodosinus mongolicus]|uniref:Phosphocarrier protein n=1 Tax=Ectothiorhodosinus mongolicus TaxID=233100 RepID=A0A1R3VQK5_9GAMM|nr:HPr family phosphocarrier protein [Ectothiorhodosinus mongolicus]ULX56723.1 HPr family phosphocarrier protein [Ectothiorhodosinus mongolicus]SIT67001.1 phosphocarrier protein [Ectothiorhodosinus mongolicus]
MVTREITIINKLGMHARAAAKFVNLTSGFVSELFVEKGEKRVNGKSIMGVMMLAASRGSSVTLMAEGEDAEAALDACEALINDRFGEPE